MDSPVDKQHIPQSLSHHEYSHRMMKLLGVVHTIGDGNYVAPEVRTEFIIRSAMISNLLVADMHEKLEIEAGTLSFIPQYVPWNTKNRKYLSKLITNQFGKNRAMLVKEVEELRNLYNTDQEDMVDGCSVHAKTIYSYHIYLDLVNMLNPNQKHKVIDGYMYEVLKSKKDIKEKVNSEKVVYIAKGDEYVVHDGDQMNMDHFYALMICIAEWKLEAMGRTRVNVGQSIAELCKSIRQQKGVEVYYNGYNE